MPDLAVHCIDLLSFLLGPVRSVQAEVGTLVHGYRVDDTAAILLRFASGAMGMIDVHFSVPDAACENGLEVYGSKGAMKATGTIGQGNPGILRKIEVRNSKYERKTFRRVAMPRRNVYRAQIEAFSEAVLAGRRPPVSGDEGLTSQRILADVYRSAETGRRAIGDGRQLGG